MKRIVLIALIIAVFFKTVQYLGHSSSKVSNPTKKIVSDQVSPTPSIKSKSITAGGQTTNYAYVIASPDRISLIPNFSEKKLSEEILSLYTCSAGINGGFYDTNNQPLGMFSINGSVIGKQSNSKLINGFISVSSQKKALIDQEIPIADTMFILQTGPLLMLDGVPLTLVIKNDERARRMAAAVSVEGNLVFIVLYNAGALFDGPKLSDVPKILSEINRFELLNIADAINLDGGSASAFYADNVALSELTPIGSFFCIMV